MGYKKRNWITFIAILSSTTHYSSENAYVGVKTKLYIKPVKASGGSSHSTVIVKLNIFYSFPKINWVIYYILLDKINKTNLVQWLLVIKPLRRPSLTLSILSLTLSILIPYKSVKEHVKVTVGSSKILKTLSMIVNFLESDPYTYNKPMDPPGWISWSGLVLLTML